VERIIATLVVEDNPVILDLMAGFNSHLPESIRAERVVGLGLNGNELERNPVLTETVIHDVNRDPRLPFPDNVFDVVLNTVSVEYVTRPVELFREVARILRPGGLHLVIFSNRMFPEKAVNAWRESGESVRVDMVRSFFARAGGFDPPRVFASGGKPRPGGDRYADQGYPSDPVWAVYAEREGGAADRRARPEIIDEPVPEPDPEELARRMALVRETLRCPHCDAPMTRWKVPDTPFNEWDAEYVYVCFNRGCPYTVRSWNVMQEQGNTGFSYRLMYHRERDRFYCVPDVGFHGG
jgi:SAM-dependent methyltransferase